MTPFTQQERDEAARILEDMAGPLDGEHLRKLASVIRAGQYSVDILQPLVAEAAYKDVVAQTVKRFIDLMVPTLIPTTNHGDWPSYCRKKNRRVLKKRLLKKKLKEYDP